MNTHDYPFRAYDRRAGARHPAAAEIDCRVTLDDGGTVDAGILDVSAVGAGLLLDEGAHRVPGEFMVVEFRDEGAKRFRRVRALVRHSDICCPNDAFIHGCVFVQELSLPVAPLKGRSGGALRGDS